MRHAFHNGRRIPSPQKAGTARFELMSRQKELPAAAIVVLHEAFGVNADIRKTCDGLTDNDFVPIAPTCPASGAGRRSQATSEVDWQHGFCLYQAYDRDAGVRDVKDTADVVAKLCEYTGKLPPGFLSRRPDDLPDGLCVTTLTQRSSITQGHREVSWRDRWPRCAAADAFGR